MLLLFHHETKIHSGLLILVTKVSVWLIELSGLFAEASFSGVYEGYTQIKLRQTIYRVHDKCAGLPLIATLAASVGALPTKWTLRALGFTTMAIIAALVASLRIALLGWVAEYQIESFDFYHTYLMEVLTLFICVSLFAGWARFLQKII